MREAASEIREWPTGSARASRSVNGRPRGLSRAAAVAAVAAAFLAFSGAFGTGEAAFVGRLAYWLVLMAVGTVVSILVAGAVDRSAPAATPTWLRAAVATALASVPMTAAVYAAGAAFIGPPRGWAQLVWLYPSVLLVTALMMAVNALAAQAPQRTRAGAAQAAEPRIRDRLPSHLRGAAIRAVQSEDHYVRIHTDRGSELVLMRLADAIAELEGIEGAQTHRSWWVARDAVDGIRRENGRIALTLAGGLSVPISRGNVRALRQDGWF